MEKKTTKDAIRSTYEIFSSVKWEYKRLNEKECKIRGLIFSNEGAKGRTPLFDVSKSQTGGIMAYWENESKGWVCISAPEPGYEIKAPTDMSGMFAGFDDLIYLDVTHLDVSQTWYFTSCFEEFGVQKGSKIIGLNTWDISSGMDFKKMFSNAFRNNKDVEIDLFPGKFSNQLNQCFYNFAENADSVKLNLSQWDVSNVYEFRMCFWNFAPRAKKVEIYGVENWNVSKGADFVGMFFNFAAQSTCKLDLSKWNVRKICAHGGFQQKTFFKIKEPKWTD